MSPVRAGHGVGSDRTDGDAGRPRRALVLGAGGVLGFAWTVGALSALEVEAQFDARDVEALIGTSAGSITAALLACGSSVDEIRRHHQGTPAPEDPPITYEYGDSSALPPRPHWGVGSPRLLLQSVRHPRQSSAAVTLSGILPPGRGTLGPVHEMITARADPGDIGWPDRPVPWIVATDYLTGERAVFGRDDRPAALADAVVASCSIPAWYPPVVIDGRPYIDGGTTSNTSVDLLLGRGLDEVYVLAPMASVAADRPRSPVARIERAIRRNITRRLLADVAALRAEGARVIVATPGPEDLGVIGANLMNPRRRSDVLETAARTAAIELRRQLASRTHARSHRAAAPGAAAPGAAVLRATRDVAAERWGAGNAVRIYVPATMGTLRRLIRGDDWTVEPSDSAPMPTAYAVTARLRTEHPDDDVETLEYAAMTHAARTSLRLLAAAETPARRVVIAAEVPESDLLEADQGPDAQAASRSARAAVPERRDDAGAAEPAPWDGVVVAGRVLLRRALSPAQVVSVLVDDAQAAPHVAAAAAVALDRDPHLAVDNPALDDVEQHELSWYAPQEIDALVDGSGG